MKRKPAIKTAHSVKGVNRGDVSVLCRATQPRESASKMNPGLILGPPENVIEPCTNQYKLRPRTINHMAAVSAVKCCVH